MNSGCYESDISKVLLSIRVLDTKNFLEKDINKKDIKFFYRGTNLSQDFIILSAKFKCEVGKKDEIEKKQIDLIERKKLSQPSQIKTCGSTFKNLSVNRKAWMLIKESGCENLTEGDASISKNIAIFYKQRQCEVFRYRKFN